MSKEPLRVLIADDHPLFRSGMRSLLVADLANEVIGEATTGEEAVALASSLQPDIILMDLHMPGMGGIEATRRVLHSNPHIRILIVTMYEDDHSVFTAMRAGARGYLLKGASPDEVLRAIAAVGSGEAIFSPSIATRLIDFFAHLQPTALPQALPELTEREHDILTLIAQGQSNPAIAKHLALSPKTVSNYVSTIFSKLQVADRAQAMLRARQAGLGEMG
ncbi:MAG: response regulator transcription factor [Ktedonobacteraceae bacterium]|nr:response regulator transcription factor [Ktedonobacteraceae bacterium]